VTVIGVLAPSIARRRTASRRGAIGLTVLLAAAFLAVLTLIFATIDPCAQGPGLSRVPLP
jgi:Na+/H+ antiporter NhaC